MDAVLIMLVACFFVFGLPIIAMIYYFERVHRPKELSRLNAPKEIKEKVIVKEIVMIPCEYCGGLMPQTALFCPNCGAGRKVHQFPTVDGRVSPATRIEA